jgi:1-acyl-sn-glycerol-3-phosphate acyltransferase
MIFSLLYVPAVIGVYLYFGVQKAALVLILLALLYGTFAWIKTKKIDTVLPAGIALVLGLSAFLSSDFLSLKLYPLILSLIFFFSFIFSVASRRYLLIGWIEKFRKTPLNERERRDIILSHWFWIAVLGFNCGIHTLLVLDDSITLWGWYSFVGWYLLFAVAIFFQIVFIHRGDLIQWGRNIWGYGLFAGVITVGFIPAISGYVYDLLVQKDKPHRIFQEVASAMFRLFFRYAPGTAGVTLKRSDEILSDHPYIYVASHESWLDYPLMGAYITDLYHLTNKQKAFVWIIRPIARLLGVIDGVGGNPLYQLLQKLRMGSNILVFPEGSRSVDGKIQPFKKGAFRLSKESCVPIVPVLIDGTRHLVSKGSLHWRSKKGIEITVTMLSPMMIDEDESDEEFSERVHTLMSLSRKNRNG